MSDTNELDLIVRAGRIFCAVAGLDGPGAVGVKDGQIVAAGQDVDASASRTLDFPDDLLLPGLVDLHAHPARGGSKFGVDPDIEFLPRGVTTVMSQGDAGANNWESYHEKVIRGSKTRVVMALNLSASGESKDGGCFEDMNDVDVDACVRAIEENGDAVWGIAMNTAPVCCGDNDPEEIFLRGLAAAERTNRPLLVSPRQIERLRSGDVVTYCFLHEEGLVKEGRIRDEVWAARERGVLFDIGHGMQSFSFEIAEAAIAEGFYPDTISTDQYRRHVGSAPQHDLPRTLSKLLAAGMPEAELFTRATARPAEVLGLQDEAGSLETGTCADLTVLRWNPQALPLVDVRGIERPGGCWEPALTIREGEQIQPR
ncbi:MAG: amidohydrolase family protein [Planctomycetota bacterium]|jgi:dihydroorotase|nr:amidohydrolase family protein [Planctomycetota bacterium]MDP7131611.1 amidohydrolase family protein [Planctomycetota bacterium]MDP7249173.1 amidohydrolase family protein [Planctomycetota bacterium]